MNAKIPSGRLPERVPSSGVSPATVATHEAVLDGLADLLLTADETLELLEASDNSNYLWIRPHMRKIYDTVNDVLKQLCD